MSTDKYKKIEFNKISNKINNFWKRKNIFYKSIKNRKNKNNFIFYEGPPSTNGSPGIHHVMSRAIKDIFCRYKALKGYKVNRKSGWDSHGLPIELQVEKNLNIKKEDIGVIITIQEYNKKCRYFVMNYKKNWELLNIKMGYWIDLSTSYITFDGNYIESIWYLIKKLYKKNFIYNGYSIQPYSPAAGTSLSFHELNQPGCYKKIKSTSLTCQFKIKDKLDEYFLVWTTTPWTLPANTALAINKNIVYVKIKTFNIYTKKLVKIILAKDAIYKYFSSDKYKKNSSEINLLIKNQPWKILEEIDGKNLLKLKYYQILPYIKPNSSNVFVVFHADFVNTKEGTGVVHIAPNFGEDDNLLSKKEFIGSIVVNNSNKNKLPIVDKQGRFINEIYDFSGKYVKKEYENIKIIKNKFYKSVDLLILLKLKNENKVFKVEKYEHNYPHCWRTDKPILYYPTNVWFIKTTFFKKKLIKFNRIINWYPKFIGQKRFKNWLNNVVDWNLSRDRFWGTPLPIWKTSKNEETKCIGSIKELNLEIKKAISYRFIKNNLVSYFNFHCPNIDKIILASSEGKKMYRELDIIDVWFDSGSMPYGQWHYPFEDIDLFKKNYPADFIAEGVDQTRGWFFTLHAISVMLFNSIAFKNVLVNGLVLDKSGVKMSKRIGNYINPFNIINTYGADPVRWYMVSTINPWENLKFNTKSIEDIIRKFFDTVENIYNFFYVYLSIDKYFFSNLFFIKINIDIDFWILFRLNNLIKITNSAYKSYNIIKVSKEIQDFILNDISNWYLRINRRRFWKSKNNQNKYSAYKILYICLLVISKISSPISPFYMEKIYQDLININKDKQFLSVHLVNFPLINLNYINLNLEQKLDLAKRIVSLVYSLRKKKNIKIKQPLKKIILLKNKNIFKKNIQIISDLILLEVNIKKIEYINNISNFVIKKIKLNFKKVGKLYKENINLIISNLNNLSQKSIRKFEKNKELVIYLDNENIKLGIDDIKIYSENIKGWSVVNYNNITIALDINLDNSLKEIGIIRDFISQIQNFRKKIKLSIKDKIKIHISRSNSLVNFFIFKNKKYIKNEIQSIFFEEKKINL